jgi:glycopeptide antibiotics resistance protein
MAARLFLTVFVWLVCLVVSFGVEFAQVFAVSRVSSASDILAQAIGSVVGLALWWWKGEASLRWFQEWQHARGRTVLAERVLWAYLVLLFAFNVLPLDLTISPVELYHKWKAGRIIFIPFSYPMETWADGLYGLIVDVLTWVPISLLALLSGRKTGAQAWRMTVLAALLLEGLQLIVYSRVTDTTDVLTAMVGAQVGIWLGRRLTKYSPEATPPRADGQRSIMLGVIGYLVWLLVLAIVFWYPFEFTRDPQLLKARLNGLVTMPFYNYFYSTQLRAATEVVHKVAFFIPLGVILSFSRRAFTTPSARTLVDAVALTALLAAAAFVELGQVALPAKYPDITDWVLESAGAVIGYFAA